jgi:hypothetical protein
MVKLFLIIVVTLIAKAESEPSEMLKVRCLNCHIEQKIPSELIYRRYLMRYSTHTKISKIIFKYLKNPIKDKSVMPKQFFLKFPQKDSSDLNDSTLEESIDDYLNYFDIKKQLTLP